MQTHSNDSWYESYALKCSTVVFFFLISKITVKTLSLEIIGRLNSRWKIIIFWLAVTCIPFAAVVHTTWFLRLKTLHKIQQSPVSLCSIHNSTSMKALAWTSPYISLIRMNKPKHFLQCSGCIHFLFSFLFNHYFHLAIQQVCNVSKW